MIRMDCGAVWCGRSGRPTRPVAFGGTDTRMNAAAGIVVDADTDADADANAGVAEAVDVDADGDVDVGVDVGV